MDFIPKAMRGCGLGQLPRLWRVLQFAATKGYLQTVDSDQSWVAFSVWIGGLPTYFFFFNSFFFVWLFIVCLFGKAPGYYMYIKEKWWALSRHHDVEPSWPKPKGLKCATTLCIYMLFFSGQTSLSNWSILLLQHTKSAYMNIHLNQLTRKAFKVRYLCSRAKVKKSQTNQMLDPAPI